MGKRFYLNIMCCIPLLTIFVSVSIAVSQVLPNKIWKPLPLRTLAQKEAGMPGGEGMQKIFSISYAPSDPGIAYIAVDTEQVWRGEWTLVEDADGDGSPDTPGFFWTSKRGTYDGGHKGYRAFGGMSLVVDPKNPDVVFVSGSKVVTNQSTSVDGIYRTLDGGNTWNRIFESTYYRNFEGQHYIFDARDYRLDNVNQIYRHMTVYAATHEDGLLKSTDGGDNWDVLVDTGSGYIWKAYDLAIQDSDTIFLENNRISDLDINTKETDALTLYVASNNITNSMGLYRIRELDSGTLTVASIGLTPPDSLPDYPRTIALNPQDNSDNDIIYAAVGTGKVSKSVDGGQNFHTLNSLPGNPNGYQIIEISKADPNYLYATLNQWGGNHPYYSHDGGANWHQTTDINQDGLHHIDGNGASPVISPHPPCPSGDPDCSNDILRNIALVAFTGGKITETTNAGVTFRYTGNGYMGAARTQNKTSAYFGPLTETRKMVYFLLDHGPALTDTNGDYWTLLNIPRYLNQKSTPVGAVDPDNSELIITATGKSSAQVIARSDDNGNSWTLYDGTGGRNNTEGYYQFMMFHPQNSNIVYAGTDSGGWISNDKGQTWKLVEDRQIRAVFPGDGDIVYAFEQCNGTDDPQQGCESWKSILWKSNNLWCPDDDNDNICDDSQEYVWIQVTINSFKANAYDVDIDPYISDRIYLARGVKAGTDDWSKGGIWVFDGVDWTETGISGEIPSESFPDGDSFAAHAVAVDPRNPDIIYVGMWAPGKGNRRGYIYRSIDKGITWDDIGGDLGEYSRVHSLAVDPSTGVLHMSSYIGNYVLCTDADDDGYATEGGPCGNIDMDEDFDNDQMADYFEVKYELDPTDAADSFNDNDSDGLTNLDEFNAGTHPVNPDTDGDGRDDTETCPLTMPAETGGTYYATLGEAYGAASGGDTIRSQFVAFNETLNIDNSMTLEGGYDCGYTGISGITTLNGNVTISNGTVSMGDYVIE